jgi:chemotaxis protein MotB
MAEENTPQEEPKKEKKCECAAGAPAWMVTYSDLVTLLLTFFVLLLSMASMDPVRFTEASSSLKDAFGVHQRPAHVEFSIPVLPSPPVTKFSPIQHDMTTKIHRRLKTQIDTNKLSEDVDVIKKDADTIVLRISNSIVFGEGESKLAPESYPLLRYIADMIRPLPMRLRIEGHTDEMENAGVKMNNWDLSMARAASILRFLNKGDLFPIDRMGAAGYGSEAPIGKDFSMEERAKNRRVDFVLRSNKAASMEQTQGKPKQVPF